MKNILFLFINCVFVFNFLNAQTVYYSETFETGNASDWTLEDLWTTGNLSSPSTGLSGGVQNSTEVLIFDDYTAGNAHVGGGRAISPVIDLTSATGDLFLEVKVKFRNADQFSFNETFNLSISTDNGTTWELIEEYDKKDWEALNYDFSSYAGESVILSFEYSDGGGFNIGVAIDDIAIADELIFTASLDYTLTVDGGTMLNQCAQNVDYQVTGVVLNNGYENITSFDLEVTTNGMTNTYSFQTDIPEDDVYRYAIDDLINTGISPSSYNVAISNVNGNASADDDTSDNNWDIIFEPLSLTEGKAIMVEKATGMWCGACTEAAVYIDEFSKRFGEHFVGVSVHNSDLLTLDEHDAALTDLGVFGYPTAVINRGKLTFDFDTIINPVLDILSSSVIANIEVGAIESGGNLTASALVTFNQAITAANYNVSIILTEDNIQNASSSWNQTNGYAASGIYTGGFDYFPLSTPSKFWPYSHVSRALIGGFSGVNEVTGNFSNGASKSISFDAYDIPSSWDKDNMHIIAVLTDSDGEVVNVISKKYNQAIMDGSVLNTTSTQELSNQKIINVFPNPAKDYVSIDMNLSNAATVDILLMDILGRKMRYKNFGKIDGSQILNFETDGVEQGNYILQVKIEDELVFKKIAITRK